MQRVDRDGFVALVSSWSWIANLVQDERARVLDRVRSLVDADEVGLPYETALFTLTKR